MQCITHSRILKENPKKETFLILHITCSSSTLHKWKARPSTQNIECSLVRSTLKFTLTHSSWIWSSAFVRSNGPHFKSGKNCWEPLPWKVSRDSLLVLKSDSLYSKTEINFSYSFIYTTEAKKGTIYFLVYSACSWSRNVFKKCSPFLFYSTYLNSAESWKQDLLYWRSLAI